MRNSIKVLLLSYVMVAMNLAARTQKMDDYAHEPSSTKDVEEKNVSEPCSGYDVSSFSPEQQAWENLLKQHLGDFYYPLYIEAKNAGKETAWDYVEDVPGRPRILVIGDSISRGCTLPLRHELKGKVNVHRAPQNCSSTTVGIEMLDIWLGDGKWDLITFNFGIHDRDTSSADYELRLREIIGRLRATDARLVWVTTTPVPEGALEYVKGDIERLNKIAEAVMKEQNIPVLDLNRAITPMVAKYQLPENCHYRDDGYRFMGKLLAEKVMAELQAEDAGNAPENNPVLNDVHSIEI